MCFQVYQKLRDVGRLYRGPGIQKAIQNSKINVYGPMGTYKTLKKKNGARFRLVPSFGKEPARNSMITFSKYQVSPCFC